jgi:hypothetical protein
MQRRRGPTSGAGCVRAATATGLIILAYQLLWTYWASGVFVPDRELINGREVIRRHPELLTKHDPVQGRDVPTYVDENRKEGLAVEASSSQPAFSRK